jgi:hypothetical protein
MADDFYNLKRIYEDYGVPGSQTNTSQGAIARGPSYDTTRDMGGRGGPVNVTGGAPASGDLFNWTNRNHMSVEQLTEIAEQAVKLALDQTHRADKHLPELEAVYKQLLDLTNRAKE